MSGGIVVKLAVNEDNSGISRRIISACTVPYVPLTEINKHALATVVKASSDDLASLYVISIVSVGHDSTCYVCPICVVKAGRSTFWRCTFPTFMRIHGYTEIRSSVDESIVTYKKVIVLYSTEFVQCGVIPSHVDLIVFPVYIYNIPRMIHGITGSYVTLDPFKRKYVHICICV